MNEPDTNLQDYDFVLPQENIAQFPAKERDQSRLMVLCGQNPPEHHIFSDLPQILRPGDVLVRNNTKVIPARLSGLLPGGGKTEALLMHPAANHPGASLPLPQDCVCWVCLCKPSGRLKPGKNLTFAGGQINAQVVHNLGGGQVILAFAAASDQEFMHLIETHGQLPLPPYIKREEITDDDRKRYQTTFALHTGAVAAPTAGLHFTPEIDRKLQEYGVEIAHLTLHVGPGTFRPIAVEDIRQHRMDGEFYEISEACAALVNAARRENRRIITVGTTSTRTLESVTDESGLTRSGCGWADLFIRPGYRWKAISGLLTNFHLPKSSLIVLVSALMGREKILSAYQQAIQTGYRFYSYGDAMLLLP